MTKKAKKIMALSLVGGVIFLTAYFVLYQLVFAENTKEFKVPILLYHNIDKDADTKMASLHITPERFEEHMKALKDKGYNTITFNDYYDFVENNKPLPQNPIIITFDDGYSSNHQFAFPILKKLNMKATIFIITSHMGKFDGGSFYHFTWEEAKELQDSGVIDIENHSYSHLDMTKLSTEEVKSEIEKSQNDIKENLGKTSKVFSYPFGFYNKSLQKITANEGIKMQVDVNKFGTNSKSTNLEKLKRLLVPGNISGDELILYINKNKSFVTRVNQFVDKREKKLIELFKIK